MYEIGHGSTIEILLNNHVHILEFDPPPESLTTSQNQTFKRKLEDDSTSQRKKSLKVEQVSSSVKEKVEKVIRDMWDEIDKGELYVFTAKGVKSSDKIASFDMDGTLIKTKSGKVHPVDINDWQIAFPSVPQKLKEFLEKDYKIVLFSNQAPIGNGRVKIEDFKKKIESIVQKLNVPVQAYIATGKGIYRKPRIGMWMTLTEKV